MGVNVTDEELIDASNLHGKKKMKDRMAAQAQQAQQVQEMQTKMAMENQAVLTEAAHAKAQSDLSLASERTAKIQLDAALNAERMARSEEDRTAGVLNLIKAIKELESLDMDTLMKKLQIIQSIEAGQSVKEEAKGQENQMKTIESQTPSEAPKVPLMQNPQ